MNRSFVMLAAAVLSAITIANAQTLSKTAQQEKPRQIPIPKSVNTTPLMVSFDQLKWVVLPENKGMQFAALTGDHTKGGAYSQMRRVVGGTDHGMHVHSVEITDVIISGLWYAGTDMSSAKDFGPGSVIVIPAGWVHVSGCRSGSDCVFYHEGKGKFDFKPVRPKILDRKSGD